MKINVNGVTREMTPEEIAEMGRMQEETTSLELTQEERIAQLEEELRAAKILLGLEV